LQAHVALTDLSPHDKDIPAKVTSKAECSVRIDELADFFSKQIQVCNYPPCSDEASLSLPLMAGL
jgi:hypothetical protein